MNKLTFDSLGISAPLCRALTEIGYEHPTPIQAQAIPELLDGRDLLGIAQTGTGKTAAFSLPILELLISEKVRTKPKCPRVLVLAPTRELAGQIRDEIAGYAKHTQVSYACIFGGVNQNPQIKTLARGVDVLVATPGRLLDLAGSRYVDLSEVEFLVLDEADRLLDMGFIRDVKRIIKMLPQDRQSLLFSATMPREVANLAAEILDQPIRVDVAPKEVTVEKVEQRILEVKNADKQRVLQQLLFLDEVTRAIVFTRTKHGANRVTKKLDRAGIAAEAIHGNKSQNARTKALQNFKTGESWVLVATDIAARGIDVEGVSHVINFELPHEPESYVHRIGRTARAGASGVAWSLIDPSEMSRMRGIERLTKIKPKHLDVELPEIDFDESMDRDEDRRSENRHANGSRGGNGNGRQRSGGQSGNGQSGNGQRSGSTEGNGGRRRRRRRPAAAA